MNVKDVGLLLLGAGVFILSLIVFHFYVTNILPLNKGARVSSFCEDVNGNFVIRINNHGADPARDIEVLVDGKMVCSFVELTPGSSRVCLIESNTGVLVYEIKWINGDREIVTSDVCRRTLFLPVVRE